MRVTLIHNPRAGHQDYDRDTLVALVREAGHEAEYVSAAEDGWKHALHDPGDVLAVAGGDGTVAKIARRMAGAPTPIAVLPLGTANNISRSLGLSRRSVRALIAGWRSGRRLPFDLGIARGPWGTFRFLEGAGAGLLADIIAEAGAPIAPDERHGNGDDRRTVALKTIARHLGRGHDATFHLTIDDRELSGEFGLVEVLNTPRIGPGLRLAPAADPGDGLLDLVFLAAGPRRRAGAPLPGPCRGARIRMRWNGLRIHLDDKVWPRSGPEDGVRRATSGSGPGAGAAQGSEPIIIDLTLERHALQFLVPG